MTIGYVGLGSMGGALAERLLLTRELVVYDANDAAVRRLAELGATAAGGLDDLGPRCDVILLCLPTSDHVRAVLLGDGGLADTAKPGTMIIDQTSGDPTATQEMAEQLAGRGVHLVDAPVSGGAAGAAAGTISIMVGAGPEQFAAVRPLLESISPNIFHAGATGAGHTMKLVNNLISGAQRLLSFEGVALAAKNGIDPRTAIDILTAGGARNAYMERVMIPQVVEGRLNVGFTLGLGHKDVRLACQLGMDTGVPMFFGNLTRELLQMAINEHGAGSQIDTAALVVDRISGTSVVPAQRPSTED